MKFRVQTHAQKIHDYIKKNLVVKRSELFHSFTCKNEMISELFTTRIFQYIFFSFFVCMSLYLKLQYPTNSFYFKIPTVAIVVQNPFLQHSAQKTEGP